MASNGGTIEPNHTLVKMRLVINGIISWCAVLLIISGCNRCPYGCENGVCQKSMCQCDLFYEGDACERSILNKLNGQYTVNSNCYSDSELVEVRVSDTVPNECFMANEMRWVFVDSHRFEIPLQQYRNQSIHGEGQVLVNLISLSINKVDSAGNDPCLMELRAEEK